MLQATSDLEIENGYLLDLFLIVKNAAVNEKCSYFIICYQKDKTGIFFEYERTEFVRAAQIMDYQKGIQTMFVFEQKQPIKFELVCRETNEFLGQCQTTIGQVVGHKATSLQLGLIDLHGKTNGQIQVRGEKCQTNSQNILIEVECKKIVNTSFLGWNKVSPYFQLVKIVNNERKVIYTSETKQRTQDPHFEPFKISFQKLCSSDPFWRIQGELYDSQEQKKSQLIGVFEFSVFQVNDEKIRVFNIYENIKQKNRVVGQITFLKFQFDPSFLFYDYIKSGTELALIIAVDMTKSNKDPQQIDSLHSIHPQSKNEYLEAIRAVSEILLNYDHDKQVPMFGFGGRPRMANLKTNEVLHCFPLTGDPNCCEVDGLDGIVKTYLNAIQQVEFDGPTYLNMIISQTMLLAEYEKSIDSSEYYILLILTDGMYHDKSSTKKSIVKCSNLPLSIIIIGIGNEDFTDMEELDGDDGLVDDDGNPATRDLVQFVPYNVFKNDSDKLAQKVLEELPAQLVEYMETIGRPPGPPITVPDPTIQNQLKNFQIQNFSMRSQTMPVVDDDDSDGSFEIPLEQPYQSLTSLRQIQKRQLKQDKNNNNQTNAFVVRKAKAQKIQLKK